MPNLHGHYSAPIVSHHWDWLYKRQTRHVAPMVEAEAVLPVQLDPPKDLVPCNKMLLALLTDAVSCYGNGKKVFTKHAQALAHDAEEWIRDERIWLFSFELCCQHLGLESGWLRQGILSGAVTRLPGRYAFASARRMDKRAREAA